MVITFSLFVPWTSSFPLIASTSSVSMSWVLPLRARADSMGWEQTPASSPGARLCTFPGIVLVEVLKSKNKNTQERIKQIGIPKRTGYAHLVVLTVETSSLCCLVTCVELGPGVRNHVWCYLVLLKGGI